MHQGQLWATFERAVSLNNVYHFLNYSFTQNQEPLSKVGSISPAQQCQYVFASLKTSKNTADMKTTAFEIYSIVQKK